MSRSLRLEFPGSLWHVTHRGNCRQNIFFDDDDRNFFLELLGKCVGKYAWILTAYVLMSNHYHLVTQLTCESLSRGIQWLDSKYARYFNRRHGRVGHLYQGPFKAPLIEKETYFLEVHRYDALNPVRAGMVARPEDYVWSSHRAVLGMATAPEWLAVDDVLVQFAPDRDLARANYKSFVDAAIGVDTSPWKDLVGQMYLGSKEWRERIRDQVALRPRAAEHPRLQRLVGTPPMATVVASVAATLSIDAVRISNGRGGLPRMIAAWIGCHEALLTNSEIAAGLRMRSSGHVSDLVKRCERELSASSSLQDCVDHCIATIRRKTGEPKM
jgi:putative transposase